MNARKEENFCSLNSIFDFFFRNSLPICKFLFCETSLKKYQKNSGKKKSLGRKAEFDTESRTISTLFLFLFFLTLKCLTEILDVRHNDTYYVWLPFIKEQRTNPPIISKINSTVRTQTECYIKTIKNVGHVNTL